MCVARGVVSYTSVTSFGPKQRRRLALWFDLRSLACADTSAATGAMPIALPPARAANYVAVWSLPYDPEDPERWNFVFVAGTFDNSEMIDFLDRFQAQGNRGSHWGGFFAHPVNIEIIHVWPTREEPSMMDFFDEYCEWVQTDPYTYFLLKAVVDRWLHPRTVRALGAPASGAPAAPRSETERMRT